jgi:hypothetical protein
MSVATPTITDLEEVMDELTSVDQERARLVSRRDALIRSLLPVAGITELCRTTGLTTAGIYKIRNR